MVNRFPYEGGIVRKDLLPQTARSLVRSGTCNGSGPSVRNRSSCGNDPDSERVTAAHARADPDSNADRFRDPSTWHPAWLPATYDLATEVQFFLKDYRAVSGVVVGVLCR